MTDDPVKQAHRLIIAAKIDAMMADRVVSQAELARKMHTDRATVCRTLQGKEITVSTLCKFLEALGYQLAFIPKDVDSETAA